MSKIGRELGNDTFGMKGKKTKSDRGLGHDLFTILPTN